MMKLNVKQIIDEVGKDCDQAKVGDLIIGLSEQKTGYGIKKFIICPYCFNRVTDLYIKDQTTMYCRHCSPVSPYRDIQNTNDGSLRDLHYRMDRIGGEFKIDFDYPFSYQKHISERPKQYNKKKWLEGLTKLQILENMRNSNIFYNKRYSAKIINKTLKRWDTLPHTLKEIESYFIDWK